MCYIYLLVSAHVVIYVSCMIVMNLINEMKKLVATVKKDISNLPQANSSIRQDQITN